MIHAQMRVMLHHLGVPFSRQGRTTVKVLREQLNAIRLERPDEYRKVEDIVVRRLDAGSRVQPASFAKAEDLTNAIASEVKRQRVELDAKLLDKTVQMFFKEMASEIDAKVQAEGKKLHRIEVKTASNKVNKVDGVVPECFEELVRLANQRVNILMVGPSGSGKTHNAGLIAKALGLPFGGISCSAGMSESQLTGWLLPTGAKGTFEHTPSEFINRYENGGVFLFDEFDGSDPNTVVFINQAIAGDHFFLPQRFNKPMVKRHKDFVCIAAANTWGTGADAQYVGRSQLDAATLDRFKTGTVYIGYSAAVEQALVNKHVYEWATEIRIQIMTHGLRRIMSTRTMLDLTKMTDNEGWDKTQWERSYFTGWTQDELRKIGYTSNRSGDAA